MFRLRTSFFGLSPEYKEGVWEEIFALKYFGGFSIMESYNMPTQLRRSMVKRLETQLEKEADAIKKKEA
jgi:hypothetical protein